MTLSRQTVISALSALYLLFLTLLAAYNMHKTRLHSLPLATSLEAFTLALPLIAGLTTTSLLATRHPKPASHLLLTTSTSKSTQNQTQKWKNTALLTLTILSTILATLTSTHIPQSATQACELDSTWSHLFRTHNGKAIQRIQDAFDCCGLHSVVDKAFPLPSKNIGTDACSKTFGRTKSCFADWRGEERRVAGLGLVVVLGVVVWELTILILSKPNKSAWWSHPSSSSRQEEEEADIDTENQLNGAGHRVLTLGDTSHQRRYVDERAAGVGPVEEEIDQSEDGHEDVSLVPSRVQPSQLRDGTEEWASERPG